jgi:hypothetical protein
VALRDRRLAAARLIVCVALAVLHTWPLATAPHRLTRHDNADTMLNEWIVAWVAHQAPRHPLALFDANIFHPERRTLAFSEHLAVQSAMAAPLLWAGASPMLAYNVLVLLGFALSAWAMWRMAETWTGSVLAGFVAASLYAFNAHTLTRLPHVQALHLEFLPLAWLAFDRLLRVPTWRHAALLGVYAALQALTSNYLLVFTTLALGASAAARPGDWLRPWSSRTVSRLAAAGAIGAVLVAPFLVPYYFAQRDQGLTRSLDEVALYSASWRDYAATAGRLHYAAWSHRYLDGAAALFPGFTALVLAGIALTRGRAWSDPRARMCALAGLAGLALSFGPALPGYAWLYRAFPLLQGVRAAARFGFLALIGVAVLAAFGAAWLERRWGRHRAWPALAALMLVAIHGEALRAPMTYRPYDGIPQVYDTIAADPSAVVAEFPFFPVEGVFRNASYMLNSTTHWKPLVNGYSGFTPPSYVDNARALRGFPDDAARARLRSLGVTYVVVHFDAYGGRRDGVAAALAGTPWLSAVASARDVRVYRVTE